MPNPAIQALIAEHDGVAFHPGRERPSPLLAMHAANLKNIRKISGELE
jgi:hypothetical protein